MRLRKGFGTVRKLTGNRRNPYAVHPPKVNGVRPKAICYVDNYNIGVCVLNAWHNGAYYPGMELDLKVRRFDEVVSTYTSATFQSVFDLYWEHKFGESAAKELDRSSRLAMHSAWLKLEKIWCKTLDEVSILELQKIVNEVAKEYSKSTVTRTIGLIKGLYHFAIPRELCRKQYGLYVEPPKVKEEEHHDSFTDEEVEKLWEAAGSPVSCSPASGFPASGSPASGSLVESGESSMATASLVPDSSRERDDADQKLVRNTTAMLLTMIYSGYRIGAWAGMKVDLAHKTFTGGVKTAAGKNRIVPIHSAIAGFVEKMDCVFLCGKSESQFRRDMKKTLEQIGVRPLTPHSCRHTFHRLLERAGVNEADRKRLMGHSLKGDVTNGVYGHRGVEELRAEVEKIFHYD